MKPWQMARKVVPNFANTNSAELYKLLIEILTRLERIEDGLRRNRQDKREV